MSLRGGSMLALAWALTACAKDGPPVESGRAARTSAPASESLTPCNGDGLYTLPPFEETQIEASADASAASRAFEAGISAFKSGDASAARRRFTQAARDLTKITGTSELSDWALIVREISYHNALWSASVAGEVAEARAEIQKSASGAGALSPELASLLADPPAGCSK